MLNISLLSYTFLSPSFALCPEQLFSIDIVSLVQIRERKRSNASTQLDCLTASRQRFMSPRIRGEWRSERSILLSTSVLMEPIIGLTAGEYLIRLDGGWRECKLRYPPVIHISATRCSHWKLPTRPPSLKKCLTRIIQCLVELAQWVEKALTASLSAVLRS